MAGVDRDHEALRTLHQIASALNAETDPRKLVGQILDGAIQMTRAERGYLILVEPVTVKLKVVAARNLDRQEIKEEGFKYSRTIIIEAVSTGQPVIVKHAMSDEIFGGQTSVTTMRLGSVAAIPLKRHGKVIGALYLDNRHTSGLFKAADMLVLDTFTSLAVLALKTGTVER